MVRSLAVYTGLRLAMFGVAWGVLLLVGVAGPLALVAALLLSSLTSLLLLRGQRDRFAEAMTVRRTQQQQEKTRLRSLLDDEGSEDRPQRHP